MHPPSSLLLFVFLYISLLGKGIRLANMWPTLISLYVLLYSYTYLCVISLGLSLFLGDFWSLSSVSLNYLYIYYCPIPKLFCPPIVISLSFSAISVVFNNHVVMYVSWLGIGINNIYGFILFMLFIVQIITGILLSFYYSSSSLLSFESVYYLSFNVIYGFIIRFLHVVGSFLCIYFIYLHFLRSFYYTFNFLLHASFLYTYLSGILILVLSLLVSFLGYCLCWGQMSYWGIQVLINILTILPEPLSFLLPELIYSSSLLILYRFFVLHFLLSIIILVLVLVHLFILHSFISSNTFINLSSSLFISFYLFIFKDFYYYFIFYVIIISFIFFYNFEFLSNPINLIHASSLSTPLHILPESYYLCLYSLLRALPNKLMGIVIVLSFFFYLFSFNLYSSFIPQSSTYYHPSSASSASSYSLRLGYFPIIYYLYISYLWVSISLTPICYNIPYVSFLFFLCYSIISLFFYSIYNHCAIVTIHGMVAVSNIFLNYVFWFLCVLPFWFFMNFVVYILNFIGYYLILFYLNSYF